MESTGCTEHITALHRSLEEMAGNIAYVRGELPSVSVGEEIRASIRAVCDEFDSMVYDVRKEVWTLADMLQPADGTAISSSAEPLGDPANTVSLISAWLRRELQRVHELVASLQGDPALSLAYILVAESAVNIFAASSRIAAELDAIKAGLDCEDKR